MPFLFVGWVKHSRNLEAYEYDGYLYPNQDLANPLVAAMPDNLKVRLADYRIW